MKKYIVLLLLMVFCAGLSRAQGRIDKVIDWMEDRTDVETTYTERRSPKKKKLMATSRIFNFDNSAYFKRLTKAFEEERNNSISAVKTKNQMTYRFDNDKGVSTYTLSWQNENGPFTMVMTWRSSDAGDSSYNFNDIDCLEIGSGDFSMGVDELMNRLENSGSFNNCSDGYWSFSNNGQVISISCQGSNNRTITISTVDDFGCPVSMEYGSDDYKRYVRCEKNRRAAEARKNAELARKEAAKARCEARKQVAIARKEAAKARAQARKDAAEARQNAAKARREAIKARAQSRKEVARARAEAQKAAARARRDAARSRKASMYSDRTEKIYELAARSNCRIISPAGTVTEVSALDALDNDAVWSALEKAVDNGNSKVSATISGSTTTVIIEPEPERI